MTFDETNGLLGCREAMVVLQVVEIALTMKARHFTRHHAVSLRRDLQAAMIVYIAPSWCHQ